MEDHASKTKGLIWVGVAVVIGVVCAYGLSPLAHAIPWNWEKKMGAALAPELPGQECRANVHAGALLQKLAARLYPLEPQDGDFSIEVQVVKNAQVNAYATLGGRIYVNAGLLKQAQSPEEVAGVLAHEITHVARRHIMEGAIEHAFTSAGLHALFGDGSSAATWSNYFLKMDFSRRQEAQADEGGLERLQKAHVDNKGFKDFFARMEETSAAEQFLSDHPANNARIEMVGQYPVQNPQPIMTPGEWKILKSYCTDR
jgi:predicted Zn-dependent protease